MDSPSDNSPVPVRTRPLTRKKVIAARRCARATRTRHWTIKFSKARLEPALEGAVKNHRLEVAGFRPKQGRGQLAQRQIGDPLRTGALAGFEFGECGPAGVELAAAGDQSPARLLLLGEEGVGAVDLAAKPCGSGADLRRGGGEDRAHAHRAIEASGLDQSQCGRPARQVLECGGEADQRALPLGEAGALSAKLGGDEAASAFCRGDLGLGGLDSRDQALGFGSGSGCLVGGLGRLLLELVGALLGFAPRSEPRGSSPGRHAAPRRRGRRR